MPQATPILEIPGGHKAFVFPCKHNIVTDTFAVCAFLSGNVGCSTSKDAIVSHIENYYLSDIQNGKASSFHDTLRATLGVKLVPVDDVCLRSKPDES
ncbi:MAG: hypothetical protein KAI66_27700, partial [Lentisphaeria bacterium]|nr:hypothetical protein [Lentisphaeria bacterium]